MTARSLALALLLGADLLAGSAGAQVRGTVDATAAMERLLARVGGREAWREARTLLVEERVFLSSGAVARMRIWRDLESGNRRIERSSPGSRFVEWIGQSEAWDETDGRRRIFTPEEAAMERAGIRQEPYSIYQLLARGDPALRVALRDPRTLYVYDGEERVLCWFILDGEGAPVSWGNFWNGRINQHYYGPLQDLGDVDLPRWGVSTTGEFRFEYVAARLNQPLPSRSEGASVSHQLGDAISAEP